MLVHTRLREQSLNLRRSRATLMLKMAEGPTLQRGGRQQRRSLAQIGYHGNISDATPRQGRSFKAKHRALANMITEEQGLTGIKIIFWLGLLSSVGAFSYVESFHASIRRPEVQTEVLAEGMKRAIALPVFLSQRESLTYIDRSELVSRIRDYDGYKNKMLVVYGPAGSGKSEAVKSALQNRKGGCLNKFLPTRPEDDQVTTAFEKWADKVTEFAFRGVGKTRVDDFVEPKLVHKWQQKYYNPDWDPLKGRRSWSEKIGDALVANKRQQEEEGAEFVPPTLVLEGAASCAISREQFNYCLDTMEKWSREGLCKSIVVMPHGLAKHFDSKSRHVHGLYIGDLPKKEAFTYIRNALTGIRHRCANNSAAMDLLPRDAPGMGGELMSLATDEQIDRMALQAVSVLGSRVQQLCDMKRECYEIVKGKMIVKDVHIQKAIEDVAKSSFHYSMKIVTTFLSTTGVEDGQKRRMKRLKILAKLAQPGGTILPASDDLSDDETWDIIAYTDPFTKISRPSSIFFLKAIEEVLQKDAVRAKTLSWRDQEPAQSKSSWWWQFFWRR
ncbi:unnamed protein product [Chrysoparadoxa australica]